VTATITLFRADLSTPVEFIKNRKVSVEIGCGKRGFGKI
jgi:hypothetical protein